jgi:hypothetical protein
MTCYTVRTLNCPSIIHLDDENFSFRPSSASRSFELFQVASVQTSQQHIWRPFSVLSAMGFLSKNKDMGWKLQPSGRCAIRTMCILVQKCSFIRQFVHTKLNGPDDSLHGPDAQASYMKIACIRSTVRTTAVMVRTRQAWIWKMRVAKLQLSWHKGKTIWTWLNSGKNFSEFGKPIAQLSVRMPYVYRSDAA